MVMDSGSPKVQQSPLKSRKLMAGNPLQPNARLSKQTKNSFVIGAAPANFLQRLFLSTVSIS